MAFSYRDLYRGDLPRTLQYLYRLHRPILSTIFLMQLLVIGELTLLTSQSKFAVLTSQKNNGKYCDFKVKVCLKS
jgi:hypothetical protein